jgi:hypothetical protein
LEYKPDDNGEVHILEKYSFINENIFSLFNSGNSREWSGRETADGEFVGLFLDEFKDTDGHGIFMGQPQFFIFIPYHVK